MVNKDYWRLLKCNILARISLPAHLKVSLPGNILYWLFPVKYRLWESAEQWDCLPVSFSGHANQRIVHEQFLQFEFEKSKISTRRLCGFSLSAIIRVFPPTTEMFTFCRLTHETVVYTMPDDSPLASLRGCKTDMRLRSSSLHKRGSVVRSLEYWGRWKTKTMSDGSVPPQHIRENMKVQKKNVQYRNIIRRFSRMSYSLGQEKLYLC